MSPLITMLDILKKNIKRNSEFNQKTPDKLRNMSLHTPPIPEILCVKNVRAIVVYGFIIKII